jgi:putative DNA primase/helicase
MNITLNNKSLLATGPEHDNNERPNFMINNDKDPYLPEAFSYLKKEKVWVCIEVTPKENGKATKLPINPYTGKLASSTDPNTWGTIQDAEQLLRNTNRYAKYKPQYIGLCLHKGLNITAIDLDNVIDPVTGEIEDWALDIIEKMDSYTEISQSGKGIHIYAKGLKPPSFGSRSDKIEIYNHARFILVTNQSFQKMRPLRDASNEIQELCLQHLKEAPQTTTKTIDEEKLSPTMSDDEITTKASLARNGDKFKRLFVDGNISEYNEDPSRADQALMNMLAFWTQDEEQLERLFSSSALGQRDKWMSKKDYRRRTIKTALENLQEVYRPIKKKEEILLREEILSAFQDNEAGDAKLFKRFFKEKYLYDAFEKEWYVWNGAYWEKDRKKLRFEDIGKIADTYQILGIEDEKLQKDLKKRIFSLKTRKRSNDVLEMTTHGINGLTFTGDWDSTPYILPCINGIIDLRTGKVMSNSPSFFIRNVCPTAYDAGAMCPLFMLFLEDIMLGHQEMIDFLKRLMGYILLGTPKEHRFIILWGENGRNGKGSLCRIIQKILGPFAKTFSPEMVLLQKNPLPSGNPRADLMNLHGTRFAIFSEINKKRALDPSQIKNLSGGDVIAARPLFSNEVRNFTPSHTLIIQTNYKPEAPAEDNALWRRALLIPFPAEFVSVPIKPNQKILDTNLEEKLLTEMSGILNWMVEGAIEYQKKGLCIPQKVMDAIDSYRDENNGIEAFIKARCEKIVECSVRCSVFRDEVRVFCGEEGYLVPSHRDITQFLESQGYQKFHSSQGDSWRGIGIVNRDI